MRWRWLAAAILIPALLIAVWLIAGRGPAYQVWLDGQFVGEGREEAALRAVVQAGLAAKRQREVTLFVDDQNWPFSLAELGLLSPVEPVSDMVAKGLQAVPAWQRRLPFGHPRLELAGHPAWDDEQLEMALQPVKQAVNREAKPARFGIKDRTPVIEPEVNGVKVDREALQELLASSQPGERIEVPLTSSVPAMTEATLSAMRIKRLIAEWSTSYDPSIPRADNVERAAMAFNGLILKPDEVLSYNATVGPVDAANGWKEAFVFENGKVVRGIGGGVCQASTTFYGAALRANLEILERWPHQLPVAYIAPSEDAAIASGYEDLKIRNTTLGYLYIETEAGDGTVTFRLYGDVPEGQQVKIESQVLSTNPYPTQTVIDRSLAPGQRVVQTHGNPGITSEAFRLVYQNGVLTKREKLSRDTYLPTAEVVAVGPAQKNP